MHLSRHLRRGASVQPLILPIGLVKVGHSHLQVLDARSGGLRIICVTGSIRELILDQRVYWLGMTWPDRNWPPRVLVKLDIPRNQVMTSECVRFVCELANNLQRKIGVMLDPSLVEDDPDLPIAFAAELSTHQFVVVGRNERQLIERLAS